MKLNYFGTLYTVHEAVKRMVAEEKEGPGPRRQREIVMTSSAMGLIGFVGYSSYSPSKFALRGLAECLRNEMLMYQDKKSGRGIGVHIYYAGTMFSPGYENENLTKPLITREVEGSSGITSEEAAKGMLKGLRKGHFAVTTDFDTNFLRVAARGVTPMANIGWDYVLGLIAPVKQPFPRDEVRIMGNRGTKGGGGETHHLTVSFPKIAFHLSIVCCNPVPVGDELQGQELWQEASQERTLIVRVVASHSSTTLYL